MNYLDVLIRRLKAVFQLGGKDKLQVSISDDENGFLEMSKW